MENEKFTQEITNAIEKKLEPFTRITTLAAMISVSIFMIVTLIRGNYQEGIFFLPFLRVLSDSTLVYITAGIIFIVTIWHLISTIRFFIKRNNK